MNLNIDLLRTFIAVSDTKGFTNAGRLVNLSQSAVSMQIRRLESEVGKQLFERGGKSIDLTREGHLLLEHARRIIKEHDKAAHAIVQPRSIKTIRFGSPEHYTFDIIPSLLTKFTKAFPNIRVELRCENSRMVKKLIERGRIDIGLSAQIQGGGQVIYYDPVVWISKPGYPIEKNDEIPLAIFVEDYEFQKSALETLDGTGIDYRIAYVSHNVAGILGIVREGLAIAPMFKSTVPPDLAIFGYESHLPALPISNVILHLAKHPPPHAVSCFAEFLTTTFIEKCEGRHPNDSQWTSARRLDNSMR